MKKRIMSLLFMAAALTAGFSSCGNDDDPAGGSTPDGNSGEKTYISLSLTSPRTYGTPQPGTTAESDIQTVDVFIYDAGGFLKDQAQFTTFTDPANSGTWTSPSIMATTTGAKQVFAVINLPASIPASTFTTVSSLTGAAQALTVAQVSTANNFIMSSDVQAATFASWDGVTGTIPASNVIPLNVKRLASKFTLEEKAALTLTGIDGGTISNIGFAVGQINASSYIAQKIVSGVVQDPNYTAPAIVGTGLTAIPPAGTDYIALNTVGTAINSLAAKYALENTNDNTIAGNLTYISVRAGFIPDKVWNGVSGGTWTENTNSAGLSTFYCIKTATGNIYFNTSTEANDYCTDYAVPTTNIVTYTNGICYYTVYVNKANNYDVLRNDFYQAKIDKILGLGDSAPGPVNPLIPVATITNIQVEITVVPWNLETEDFDLTPQ